MPDFRTLPLWIWWHVWLHRNLIIFEGGHRNMEGVVKKIMFCYQMRLKFKRNKVRSISAPSFMDSLIIDNFEGASQENGLRCGAGGVIILSSCHQIYWKLNLGHGSNTMAEIVGLWALLFLARYLGVSHLQVCSDSMVIINWFAQKQWLCVLDLEYWKC